MDRFGDTNLAHGVVVKVGKGWRGSGGRSGRPSTNHSSSDKTRLNDLSYGIKIWTNLSSVLLQYWPLTDGQTDTFLIARPRWHSMQQNDMRETEGKKKEGWPPWLCDLYNLTVWPQQVATKQHHHHHRHHHRHHNHQHHHHHAPQDRRGIEGRRRVTGKEPPSPPPPLLLSLLFSFAMEA